MGGVYIYIYIFHLYLHTMPYSTCITLFIPPVCLIYVCMSNYIPIYIYIYISIQNIPSSLETKQSNSAFPPPSGPS